MSSFAVLWPCSLNIRVASAFPAKNSTHCRTGGSWNEKRIMWKVTWAGATKSSKLMHQDFYLHQLFDPSLENLVWTHSPTEQSWPTPFQVLVSVQIVNSTAKTITWDAMSLPLGLMLKQGRATKSTCFACVLSIGRHLKTPIISSLWV